MGIFFEKASDDALREKLESAHARDPMQIGDVRIAAAEMARSVRSAATAAPTRIIWSRLIAALTIVLVLGVAGLATATNPAWDGWNAMFLHSFELAFGIVIGTLGGEAARMA